jgi:hypothetical protein
MSNNICTLNKNRLGYVCTAEVWNSKLCVGSVSAYYAMWCDLKQPRMSYFKKIKIKFPSVQHLTFIHHNLIALTSSCFSLLIWNNPLKLKKNAFYRDYRTRDWLKTKAKAKKDFCQHFIRAYSRYLQWWL